jgi:hypothetical protein
MRIDLPDGQWADIADLVTHGREKAIARAGLAAREDITKAADIPTAIVSAFLLAWLVRGEDGQDLPITLEGIDGAPDELVLPVLNAIRDLRNKGNPAPNPKAATS